MKRRGFFGSLVAALAAPVIVKAAPAPSAPVPSAKTEPPDRKRDDDVEYSVDGESKFRTRGDDKRRHAFMAFMRALDETVDQGCVVDEREWSPGRYSEQWVPIHQVWRSGFTPESAAAAGRRFGEAVNAAGCHVFARLELPQGVYSADRLASSRVSARMVVDYCIESDALPVRIDVWVRKAS